MCHGDPLDALPAPEAGLLFEAEIAGLAFGPRDATTRIALLPDIYGTTPFYRQIATRYAAHGARVFLVNPFHAFGALPEATREAGFARRMKVADSAFLDAFEAFAHRESVTGIAGFCLGGFYIFDLVRRDLPAALVGLYGFPQGMENRDPLPVPFDYLHSVTRPFTMLMPAEDDAVGPRTVRRLADMAPQVPAMDLVVYPQAGHGFLPELDSGAPEARARARDALRRMDAALLGEEAAPATV